MRTLLLLVILFTGLTQLSAQKRFKRNTIYGEIGGNGAILSINYERQLANKPGWGLFGGVGLGGDLPMLNAGAKYLFELGNQKSYLEAGAGMFVTEYAFIAKTTNTYVDDPMVVGVIPALGYRHHTTYGLMWRINYTPVFSVERTIPIFFGISLGWRL